MGVGGLSSSPVVFFLVLGGKTYHCTSKSNESIERINLQLGTRRQFGIRH